MAGTQNIVVVAVMVVVGTQMVDMMMSCYILRVVGTQTVDMLIEVVDMLMMMVEMMMRKRSVVGGFEGMCTDLMYPCDIVVEKNEEEYGKLQDPHVVELMSTTYPSPPPITQQHTEAFHTLKH
ncbi:hypothetical protein QL285_045909 [Trifolium repens]|nr:hypothetical protein QL285_045909 [Trifolium repens]